MGLSERLKTLEALGMAPAAVVSSSRPANGEKAPGFAEALKSRLHEQLVAQLDLSTIDKLPPAQVTQQLQQIIGELMSEIGNLPLNRGERAVLTAEDAGLKHVVEGEIDLPSG